MVNRPGCAFVGLCFLALFAAFASREAQAQQTAGAGLERRVLNVGDRERHYFVYAPPQAHEPMPLVFVLHGGGGSALQMRGVGFEAIAAREDFLVVYPQGWNNGWADGRNGARVVRRAEGADDVAYFNAMIADLSSAGLVDPRRVFVTGASNGGFMSFRLACELDLAAIAPVIAAMAEGFSEDCAPRHPVPVFMINGTDDRLVLYQGGPVAGNTSGGVSLSVDATTAQWRAINGCSDAAETRDLPDNVSNDNATVTEFLWARCTSGAPVKLYRVNNGGHAWHGPTRRPPQRRVDRTGPTSMDFIATEDIWAFFEPYARAP